MEEKWISMKEVCQHLGVSRDTVKKMIKENMPAYKFDRQWKFKISEVDAWMRNYRVNLDKNGEK